MSKVVLIMTDTQRWDMLGCYGNPDMKTPSLDKLASQGIRFERAYTCQPVCGPARSALFTGTFPHSNGSWGNSMALGENIMTVGQYLHKQDMHTAYIGKWHLDGGDYFGQGRSPAGWDETYWYDMRNYLEELTPEERQASRKPSFNEDEHVTEEITFGHRCSTRAIDFLAAHKQEDFLLVVSYDEPHHPYICPRPYSQMYKDYEFPHNPNMQDTLAAKPEHQRVWANGRHLQDRSNLKFKAPYFLGCNSFVDYEIGRVLQAIDQHTPEALVMYTSDHGDFMGSHCLQGKGAAMYDEITRIPFIVRYPGESTGQTCKHPVSHIDIVPTIMDHMGAPLPKVLQGKSMLQTFRNVDLRPNEMIFMEFCRYEIDHDSFGGFQPIRACFDGQHKLVINLLASDELYDLKIDPHEMVNLIDAEEYSPVRKKLHDSLLDWMNNTRDPFRGYYWERRPWRRDARAASWDYTGMTRQQENEEHELRQLDYSTGLEMARAVRKK